MARRRRSSSGAGAQWRALVSKSIKKYGSGRGMKEASKLWRSNKPKSTKRNPWVKGYSVPSHWRPTAKQARRRRAKGITRKPPMTSKIKEMLAARSGSQFMLKNPKRRSKRSYRRNPFTYTVGSVVANPKRRRKAAKRSYRRNPFTYTVGPVVANPKRRGVKKYRRNPAIVAQAKGAIKSLMTKDFLVGNLAPLGGGFLGSRVITSRFVMPFLMNVKADLSKPEEVEKIQKRNDLVLKCKPLIELGVGIVGGIATGFLTKNANMGMKVITGAALSGLATWIEGMDAYKSFSTAKGLGGLGTSAADEVKKRLAAAIKKEVEGTAKSAMGAFVTSEQARGMGAFATEADVSGRPPVTTDSFLADPALGY